MTPPNGIAARSWLPSVLIWILICASCSGVPILLRWISGQTFNAVLAGAVLFITFTIAVYAHTGKRMDVTAGSSEATVGTLYTNDARRGTLALSHTEPMVSVFALVMSRLRAQRSRVKDTTVLSDVVVKNDGVTSSDSVAFSPPSRHPTSAVREPVAATGSPSDASAVLGPCALPAAFDDQQPTCSKYISQPHESDDQMMLHTVEVEVHQGATKHHGEYDSDARSSHDDHIGTIMGQGLISIEDTARLHGVHRSTSPTPTTEAGINVPVHGLKPAAPGESYEGGGLARATPQLSPVLKHGSGITEGEIELENVVNLSGVPGVRVATNDIQARTAGDQVPIELPMGESRPPVMAGHIDDDCDDREK